MKPQKIAAPYFDGVADALASGQSVYLGFGVGDAAWKTWGNDSIPDYVTTSGSGHAVAAVGYRTQGPRGREILVHNSWGPKWGSGGYAWVSENTVQTHCTDAFVIEVTATGPATSSTAGGFPLPLPLGLPGIPGFGPPSAGAQSPGGPAPAGCPVGQVNDLVTRACAAPCANGVAPASGFCVPLDGR